MTREEVGDRPGLEPGVQDVVRVVVAVELEDVALVLLLTPELRLLPGADGLALDSSLLDEGPLEQLVEVGGERGPVDDAPGHQERDGPVGEGRPLVLQHLSEVTNSELGGAVRVQARRVAASGVLPAEGVLGPALDRLLVSRGSELGP